MTTTVHKNQIEELLISIRNILIIQNHLENIVSITTI